MNGVLDDPDLGRQHQCIQSVKISASETALSIWDLGSEDLSTQDPIETLDPAFVALFKFSRVVGGRKG